MYSFANDYSEGAHESILAALIQTNREQTDTYGLDTYCAQARAAILQHLDNPNSRVHFLMGGTQANLTLIAAALRPHQGVISADSGHINVHESGAIEATGHKVLSLPATDGKLTAQQVADCIDAHYADPTAEHMVQPALVYISHPTEIGTLYTKAELAALSDVCRKRAVRIYLDGARLGCALMAEGSDVTMADLSRLTDAFTIGGTKMGALFGEALVINTPALNQDFRYILKQHGGMAAKGRILGIQFLTLFTDGLYFSIARHALHEAKRLREGIAALGYPFLSHSVTNQLFPILPNAVVQTLSDRFTVNHWGAYDDAHETVRLCTCWATDPNQVDAFLAALKEATE